LNDMFPQCVNGYVIASAEGYETSKYIVDSVDKGDVIVLLEKKYELELEVQEDSSKVDSYAIVTFDNGKNVLTVSYPEQKEVELTEGQYEIKVYVYTNSSIRLDGERIEECVDIPKSGLLGIFGATEEKCFVMDIPDQVVSHAVSGGGKQDYYISESELQGSDKLTVNADGFGVPDSVEDLQINFNAVEVSGLEVMFD